VNGDAYGRNDAIEVARLRRQRYTGQQIAAGVAHLTSDRAVSRILRRR